MDNIVLNLTVEEVNAVIQVIGQLPTSSGAFPLLMKIKEQGESQINQAEQPTAPVVE